MARGGVSAAVILKSIGGIHFPATKQQIVDYVKENASGGESAAGQEQSSENILRVLNEIEDKEYEGPNEILKQVGEVE